MNKARRTQIQALITSIAELRKMTDLAAANEAADSLKSDIEEVSTDEQDYFDNMPESLQGGEKGDAAQSAVDALNSAADCVQEFLDFDPAEDKDDMENFDWGDVTSNLDDACA